MTCKIRCVHDESASGQKKIIINKIKIKTNNWNHTKYSIDSYVSTDIHKIIVYTCNCIYNISKTKVTIEYIW